jgi:hypothetical protein
MSQEATISLAQFNDTASWDHVSYNVPIFTEHELWEVPHPWKADEKLHLAVLPGDPKPTEGKMLYSIGPKELEATADKINTAFNVRQTPVVVTIGHRNQAKAEKDQPAPVGYGPGGAKVVAIGPKNVKHVVLDKVCYIKGKYEEAKGFPHRSPEFKPLTGQLTGLALLRNDPKLPMGVTYQLADKTVCYGAGFMEDEREDEKSAEGREKKKETSEAESEVPPSMEHKGTAQDPTKPPTVNEPDAAEHEAWKAHMEHYKRTDPMMCQMCKNYEAESAKALETKVDETPAKTPDKGAEKVMGEEPETMADTAVLIQYKQLTEVVTKLSAKVDLLSTSNQTMTAKYAASEAKRIVQALTNEGYVIKNPKRLMDKLASTDDAGRKAIVEDVRENYAQVDPGYDPSRVQPIEVYNHGLVETGDEDPTEGFDNQPTIAPEDMTAAIKYAEDNKLDMDKDWDKICAHMAKQNGRAVRA